MPLRIATNRLGTRLVIALVIVAMFAARLVLPARFESLLIAPVAVLPPAIMPVAVLAVAILAITILAVAVLLVSIVAVLVGALLVIAWRVVALTVTAKGLTALLAARRGLITIAAPVAVTIIVAIAALPVAIAAGIVLAIAAPLSIRPHLVGEGAQDSVIVLGVLLIALGQHPVSAGGGITCEREILLVHLMRIAADPDIRPVAVKSLVAVRGGRTSVATTTPPTFRVWTLSHHRPCFCVRRREPIARQRTSRPAGYRTNGTRFSQAPSGLSGDPMPDGD